MGSRAPGTTGRVCTCAPMRSGPAYSQVVSTAVSPLSMSVESTSWVPKRPRSQPARAPSAPPPPAAAARHTGTARTAGVAAGSAAPTSAAVKTPASPWPSAPMLNSRARSAKATEAPAKMSGVAFDSTCPTP